MRWFWHDYELPENGVNLSTSAPAEKSPAGQILSYTYTFSLKGTLRGATQAAVTAAVQALQAACARQDGDLILYHDDMSQSSVVLKTAGSLYGVKCTLAPSFPTTFGTENLLKRTFNVTFEATYPTGVNPDGTGTEDPELSDTSVLFRETVTITKGLPRVAFHEDINGLAPIKEIIVPVTTWKASQQGQAVGYLGYPIPPPPIWPADQLTEDVTDEGSEDGVKNWTRSWSYTFESAGPLVGYPHYWRRGGFDRGD